jgi:hypothetical protein
MENWSNGVVEWLTPFTPTPHHSSVFASRTIRTALLPLLALCVLWLQSVPAAEPVTTLASNTAPPTVGMEGQLEVLLPPDLRAVVATNKSALLLRVASTRPHGSQVHYDLRYIGRVPGKHDLRDYLIDVNGAPATNLPPLAVEVAGILPKAHNGWLEDQALRAPSIFGGYRGIVGTVIVVWALLLVPLVFMRRRKPVQGAPEPAREPSLADRLKPLVEQAAAGELSADGKATLERMLIQHWQRRLQLADATGERLIQRLREHPEAGRLLRALEDWLHRPPGSVTVNVDNLLAPYRQLPAEPKEEV